MQACASLPPVDVRPPSAAIPASLEEALGRIAQQSVAQGSDSAFRPLPISAYSMDARLALARHAQRSLDLQYYPLQNDSTGRTLLRAVRDAAQRGVRVRILVDDLYTASSDRMLLGLAAYPQVEIRLFNPFPSGRAFMATRWAFSLFDFARVNHRMHNKMFIADGAFAVAGGRNIADEYFFHSNEGNFIDFDLLIAGAAVPRMEAIFDRYWNSRRVYPLGAIEASRDRPEELRAAFDDLTATSESAFAPLSADEHDPLGYSPLSRDIERPALRMLQGRIDVIADDPEKVSGRSERGDDETTVTSQVIAVLQAANAQVLLASPYFVPGRRGMNTLEGLRARDVEVKVVTNTLAANDEPFASAAYARYRKRLLEMGVDVYEVSSKVLKSDRHFGPELGASIGRSHAKIAVIDRRTTFVGSMNLDFRSSRENTELGLLIDSPELADDVSGLIDGICAVGTYHLKLRDTDRSVQWVTSKTARTTCTMPSPRSTSACASSSGSSRRSSPRGFCSAGVATGTAPLSSTGPKP